MAPPASASVPGEPRRANLHVPRSANPSCDPHAGLALGPAAGPDWPLVPLVEPEPIMAAVVVDMQGQRWTLLPLVWRENAPLCAGTMLYRLGDATFGVACRARSAWSSVQAGYCCRCFARVMDLGNSEEEN